MVLLVTELGVGDGGSLPARNLFQVLINLLVGQDLFRFAPSGA